MQTKVEKIREDAKKLRALENNSFIGVRQMGMGDDYEAFTTKFSKWSLE